DNLFANSLIALNANTGERIWHYQLVRHDMWDRDLPCPPNLLTVTHNGKKIDAVAQVTKSAHVFLFNRETGEPLFPIIEHPVPASKLKGEQAAATQPIPSKPPQFSRGVITTDDLTRRTPEAFKYALSIFNNADTDRYFAPPSENGAIIFPGLDGGGEWGGGAIDPESATLYINASEMPWVLQMLPFNQDPTQSLVETGHRLYKTNCQICHGKELLGGDSKATVPPLVNLKERLDEASVAATIRKGKGAMPAFGRLDDLEVKAIAAYLLEKPDEQIPAAQIVNRRRNWPYPYFFNGYKRFQDMDGYPAIKPPWGTLNAINLNTGELSWKVPFGSFPELEAQGIENTGSESYGGPVVTKGGLIFIAASQDEMMHAYDKDTGDLLWQTKLPAGGFATPATYMVDGKQYVVIACGGGKMGRPSGDGYVAFGLE
ncbi:MAG: c-type cytochrome, partial [Bacteroidota bacterium]